MIRPLSQTLTELITIAESMVTRARYASPAPIGQFNVIAAEVREAEKRPAADGTRTTYGAIVMVNAIEAFHATGGDAGNPWQMLIGTALPLLRTDAWLAFQQEKAAQQETRR
ncbi:hypothetical protein [Bradyrhizobium elkanii]|uniref:hypothetical protein n=1 Tax=Bradyrhizobium elkanii TaxID=29448 RepID=UPI00086BBBE0|nr:hypothetical protein [Bradyrhizobium elkanii]ODM71717.1 hypothetical protein A6X20_07180 [Bradyrhizobium elkanii]ODM79090.1 hypothetical protein A6452_28765 [Bradyrhizobium elkanii]